MNFSSGLKRHFWENKRESEMKRIVVLLVAVLLLLCIAGALWWRFNGGVSHQDICDVVRSESQGLHEHVERRYQDLDKKLDRIEGKLDRLLKIADRPLPDGMQRAE